MKSILAKRTISSGIAIAPATVVKEVELTATRETVADPFAELKRFRAVIEAVCSDLEELAPTNEIFAAHLELAQDTAMIDAVTDAITTEKKNAEWALSEAVDLFYGMFMQIEDEYLRTRAVDLKDVERRMMQKLKGIHINPLADIDHPTIVVARDLTPSDTAVMDLSLVKGFITQEGGVTSHVSIIAKSLGLPALVGVEGILDAVADGSMIAMDAASGQICIEPDEAALVEFQQKQAAEQRLKEELGAFTKLPSVSSDGHSVKICANVGCLDDIRRALQHNPDGVGLFRTEFLFLGNDEPPTEEEQFEVYKGAAELLGDKELIIRTLDIGGDKALSFIDFGNEANPFLGYRAIRICLDREDIFRCQLRALLRASAYGDIRIMYPMIISIQELEDANKLLEKCKQELRDEGIPFNEAIKVGMMIETPASVILADKFATRVDFFSIGTNDLTQYILAVDRGNEKISTIYDPFEPAVLTSIQHIISAGHRAGIPVGMCGEFAGDPSAFSLLLGMGLDEFSMPASSIPATKKRLHFASYEEAKALAGKIQSCCTRQQIKECLCN